MIFLRCLAALCGVLILLIAPQHAHSFASAIGAGTAGDGAIMLSAVAVSALMSSGFFFVAAASSSVMRKPPGRALATLLLAIPFTAGAWLLLVSERLPLLWFAAPLVTLTLIAFIAFVWPGARRPRRRYVRMPEGIATPGFPTRSSD